LVLTTVICTRNRPDSVRSLLSCVAFRDKDLKTIVLVDSSDVPESMTAVFSQLPLVVQNKLRIIRSSPGLPHQRNVGTQTALEDHPNSPEVRLAYLDDDVLIQDDYFQIAQNLHSKTGGILGAWDSSQPKTRVGIITKILSALKIRGANSYSLSRSALTTAGRVSETSREADWIPGHSFVMSSKIWQTTKFSEEIRMTGEDLDFQLRLPSQHKLYLSSELTVLHLRNDTDRHSSSEAAYMEAVLRYSLGRKYPDKFDLGRVQIGTVILAFVAFIREGTIKGSVLGYIRYFREVLFRPLLLTQSATSAGLLP
jgi:glycosyltransferase involved in cell wall biosynthesis